MVVVVLKPVTRMLAFLDWKYVWLRTVLSSQKLPTSLQTAWMNQTVEDWEVKIAVNFFVDLVDVSNDGVIHVENIHEFGHQSIDQEISKVDQHNQSYHIKQSEVKTQSVS